MSYYRKTRVQQERVANQGYTSQIIEGYQVEMFRSKRNARILDKASFERDRASWRIRCWKNYRKTQYKPH